MGRMQVYSDLINHQLPVLAAGLERFGGERPTAGKISHYSWYLQGSKKMGNQGTTV
jgi:hypothetical protein